MNTHRIPPAGTAGATAAAETRQPPVLVKQLFERDRRRLLKHFLALQEADRLLRFGSVMSNQLIAVYVRNLDFSCDTVYGVYNRGLELLGVGHLAFAARGAPPAGEVAQRVAELGVSVLASARGRGIGSRLFARAAIHCRNVGIDTLMMHCLSSNQTMMHIAKKAGMEIHRERGEAEAYLKLLPANPASVLQEAAEEQVATLDYAQKENTQAAPASGAG